jgi:hypothetical protein
MLRITSAVSDARTNTLTDVVVLLCPGMENKKRKQSMLGTDGGIHGMSAALLLRSIKVGVIGGNVKMDASYSHMF